MKKGKIGKKRGKMVFETTFYYKTTFKTPYSKPLQTLTKMLKMVLCCFFCKKYLFK